MEEFNKEKDITAEEANKYLKFDKIDLEESVSSVKDDKYLSSAKTYLGGKKLVEAEIDKDLEPYAKAIKGVSDPSKALEILRKIKNVTAKTSQKFQDKYGTDKNGNIIWDFKQVVKNFIEDINK